MIATDILFHGGHSNYPIQLLINDHWYVAEYNCYVPSLGQTIPLTASCKMKLSKIVGEDAYDYSY